MESKMLPSFSDILWCPDIDGDVMSNPVMGETILSDPLATDESLEDLNHLTDLVGPELASNLLSNPSIAQPVKHVPTSVANSTSSSTSDMPPDISDLRSQDLLSTLSGVGVDIDRMFEELSDSNNTMSYGHNNNNNNNSKSNPAATSRKVIIHRKPSISDSKPPEENNNYTDLDTTPHSDLKNNNNNNNNNSTVSSANSNSAGAGQNSVTLYGVNGSSSFPANINENGFVNMQTVSPQTTQATTATGTKRPRYLSPPPSGGSNFNQQYPQGKTSSSSTSSTTTTTVQQQSKKVITNKTVLPPVVVKQEFTQSTSSSTASNSSGQSSNKQQRLNNNIPSHLQDVPKKLPSAKKSPPPEIKSENGIKLEGYGGELPRLDDECIKTVIDSRKLIST
jgi:hypothetical protein